MNPIKLKSICTELLEIFYEESGPEDGSPVMLLHGWPDAPRGWAAVAEHLRLDGRRVITPYLRGTRPTRFLSQETVRYGAGVALAQDAIDLADQLGLDRFAVVGHDWGARAAYTLAAIFPERVTCIAALALAYQPRGVFSIPDFQQSRRFWYQWFQCTNGGADAVRRDPVAFARIQWDTWSPHGWFDEAEFEAISETFLGPDWAAITLNAYRARWVENEPEDNRYRELQQKLQRVDRISTPTLMIQGAADFCDDPKESEGQERFFVGGYRRVLLEGVGHFPHREKPSVVADSVIRFLHSYD
jgi:pimeloyl-ACP methyl ester carboxylesterase